VSDKVNLAPFAHLERMDPEHLYAAGQHMRDLQGHPGWAFLQQVLGAMQQTEIERMVIKVHQQADYAEMAGFIKGVKRAFDAPQAVVLIAERVQQRNQKAAEAAERTEQ
jgi:hypothetical protein